MGSSNRSRRFRRMVTFSNSSRTFPNACLWQASTTFSVASRPRRFSACARSTPAATSAPTSRAALANSSGPNVRA